MADEKRNIQGYEELFAVRLAGGEVILAVNNDAAEPYMVCDCRNDNLFRADMKILPTFPDGMFGGIICDPPYASGAADQNAKQKSTAQKYSSAKTGNPLPDFEGDSKDQRSWTHWMTEWLLEARRVTKPGAPICMFIDWRQLPSMSDAPAVGRMDMARHADQQPVPARTIPSTGGVHCMGQQPSDSQAHVLPGVFRQAMPALVKRIHQIVEPGGIILDPFCGAGTTILATKLEGYPAEGIELSRHYAKAAKERIDAGIPDEPATAAEAVNG